MCLRRGMQHNSVCMSVCLSVWPSIGWSAGVSPFFSFFLPVHVDSFTVDPCIRSKCRKHLQKVETSLARQTLGDSWTCSTDRIAVDNTAAWSGSWTHLLKILSQHNRGIPHCRAQVIRVWTLLEDKPMPDVKVFNTSRSHLGYCGLSF